MRKFRYVKVSLSEHAVRDGKAMLPLSAQALCLPDDLVACIGLPDWRGSGKWLRLSLLERGC